VPLEGGPAEVLFDVPFDVVGPAGIDADASPDGTKFVFTRIDTTSDIWLTENFDPEAH
jgi:hypothetical protein